MSRSWFLAAIPLSAMFLPLPAASAQQEPATADQVIARYLEAVGADRFSSITTLVERGDLYGNLRNFWHGSSPTQSQGREHGAFEFYYKSPNLRFSSTVTEKNLVIGLHGCDGKVTWYIDTYLKHEEFKPKPGNEYDCEEGFKPEFSRFRDSKIKVRLLKKKSVEGRLAWEIKVDDPKSEVTETCYFDAETFFLLRSDRAGSSVTYSDYRDIGGMKVPFLVTHEYSNSKLVTTLREVKINTPIDDSRFIQPQVKNGVVTYSPVAPDKNDAEVSGNATPAAVAPGNAETAGVRPSKTDTAANTTGIVEVNYPNFTSCAVKELQSMVPEIKGLKPAANQEELITLLDKIGARTLDIARNTPNLISRETVIESQHGAGQKPRDYDYLILARVDGQAVGLDEFRVDQKSGTKFETDEIMKKESSALADLERASREVSMESGRPPLSQGFATSWVHFYPLNRSRARFRYLGEQKMDGQRTLVLAFAQKPESVMAPAIVQYQGKNIPMFLQGVAWVDPSEFRILRLRTDLLTPLPEIALNKLTADIQFSVTRIKEVALPLSLPREVSITTDVGGSTVREIHKYSEYRLFRAKSRIVVNP